MECDKEICPIFVCLWNLSKTCLLTTSQRETCAEKSKNGMPLK